MKKTKKQLRKTEKELYNKEKYILNATYTRMNRRMDRELQHRLDREI